MIESFLHWFFLIGLIIATVQDLKRREIDFWLCGILLSGGVVLILFNSILKQTLTPVIQLGISLLIFLVLMKLFYHSRIFAGGDSNLLFSLSPLFIGITYVSTITNSLLYVLFLLFAGSIYGLISLAYLYLKNFKTINKALKLETKKIRLWLIILSPITIILFLINFNTLGMIGSLLILYTLLYVFSKTIEEKLMTKEKSAKDLAEGDWIAEDIKVGNKTIKYSWDGLSKKEIKLLKNKKVKVKYGIPFAPAFLIAHIAYWLFKDKLLLLLGL
jgi:hypothetical protein